MQATFAIGTHAELSARGALSGIQRYRDALVTREVRVVPIDPSISLRVPGKPLANRNCQSDHIGFGGFRPKPTAISPQTTRRAQTCRCRMLRSAGRPSHNAEAEVCRLGRAHYRRLQVIRVDGV